MQTDQGDALVGEAGWQPPIAVLKPWVSAGYSFGSGDSNPSDNQHTTFFQVLPTPRPYAYLPFYDMENNEDFYGTLNLRPFSRLQFRAEIHALRLAQRNDLWYLGGGAYQPQTFGYVGRPSNGNASLANVGNFQAIVQVTHTLGFTLFYGRALGKSVIASIYPNNKNAQFGYLEADYRF